MLEVMEELNAERDRPPAAIVGRAEPATQHPDAGQHHERVAVVEKLGADEPREHVAEGAMGHRDGPAHDVNLVHLEDVLGPVRQHDHHEDLQRALVPLAVQTFQEHNRGV